MKIFFITVLCVIISLKIKIVSARRHTKHTKQTQKRQKHLKHSRQRQRAHQRLRKNQSKAKILATEELNAVPKGHRTDEFESGFANNANMVQFGPQAGFGMGWPAFATGFGPGNTMMRGSGIRQMGIPGMMGGWGPMMGVSGMMGGNPMMAASMNPNIFLRQFSTNPAIASMTGMYPSNPNPSAHSLFSAFGKSMSNMAGNMTGLFGLPSTMQYMGDHGIFAKNMSMPGNGRGEKIDVITPNDNYLSMPPKPPTERSIINALRSFSRMQKELQKQQQQQNR